METPAGQLSPYYDLKRTRRLIVEGNHRQLVGGLWDEVGRLTYDYLVAQDLTPGMNVLDVGCGCLRVGVHLIDYLEPRRYWGVDLSQELLDAGFERELQSLQWKLPRDHLLADAEFAFSRFEAAPRFDVVLALSLFTHLPWNHLRLFLTRLAPRMAPGGTLYSTFFLCRKDQEWEQSIHHERGGITTHPARNPYHYLTRDIQFCTVGLPWSMNEPIDWNHPRDQAMVSFDYTD